MAANAPQHQQGNALPIMPPHFTRPAPTEIPTSPSSSSSSSLFRRSNLPSRLQQSSFFGQMLMTGGMDEDVARSLALPPPSSDTLPSLTTGQTRPSANSQVSTTLPLRNPQFINTTPWHPQTGLPPSYHRSHQRTPSLGSASDSSDSSIASLASSNMDTKPDPNPAVKRKDVDGDCSICWEPFEAEKNELLWCKLTCGNNFHKKCFVEWLVTPKHQRTSPDLTCPFCRGNWDPAELRTLQIESGITPPRPYKRPRPDFPTRRTDMRRLYRDRRTARTEFQPGMVRPGGDSYRPNYAARMTPGMSQAPQAPHPINTSTPNYGPPLPSMRSGHVSQPTSPQAPMPSSRYNSVPHYPLAYPSQPMSYAPQLTMPTPYGNNNSHFQPYTGLQAMTATPQSHDLTAQGYNVPAFSPNTFTPMTPQQRPMPAGPSHQRPISRCPAMRAQQQMSPVSPPALNAMGSPTSQYFCPGMMGPTSFESVQINYQYNTYYHFAGSMMP